MRISPHFFLILCFFTPMICLAQIPSNPIIEEEEEEEEQAEKKSIGHAPGSGFQLVDSEKGTLNLSTFVTIRYLNQAGLDDSYTDSFGRPFNISKRNDLQFQKVTLYFKGWLFDPNFRYLLYVWTSNANIGLGAQVVLAGNVQYRINDMLDIGVGIGALPTSRSLYGQWPFWLRQDARPMVEEFFRGSFTTGIWAQGELAKGLYYKTMLGNNLSQLGIDAGQLDDGFDTWSTALWWTTRDYGRLATFGDFERHESLATMLGASFTRSNETSQSQPGSQAPENSQIRLSDGTSIFSANAFDEVVRVDAAKYEMLCLTGGVKYKGYSFDAEYYLRWISKLETTGDIAATQFFDHGIGLQGSAMLVDKTLQFYTTGSYIFGEYGEPWEITAGLNWFMQKSRVMRINPEIIFVDRSPVGYLSYPTVVGATGTVFMLNFELFF